MRSNVTNDGKIHMAGYPPSLSHLPLRPSLSWDLLLMLPSKISSVNLSCLQKSTNCSRSFSVGSKAWPLPRHTSHNRFRVADSSSSQPEIVTLETWDDWMML
eukprot:scaffold158478_cov52-Attheya_sp.AAC.1